MTLLCENIKEVDKAKIVEALKRIIHPFDDTPLEIIVENWLRLLKRRKPRGVYAVSTPKGSIVAIVEVADTTRYIYFDAKWVKKLSSEDRDVVRTCFEKYYNKHGNHSFKKTYWLY